MQIQVAPKMGVREDVCEFATGVGAICALESLCLRARLHHVPADSAKLVHLLALDSHAALHSNDLHRAARHLGLNANLLRMRQTVGQERQS